MIVITTMTNPLTQLSSFLPHLPLTPRAPLVLLFSPDWEGGVTRGYCIGPNNLILREYQQTGIKMGEEKKREAWVQSERGAEWMGKNCLLFNAIEWYVRIRITEPLAGGASACGALWCGAVAIRRTGVKLSASRERPCRPSERRVIS